MLYYCYMEIKNFVKELKNIDWKDLKDWEFNNLKDSKNRDVTKLKQTILEDGFSFPFVAWEKEKYVIDGMGRRKAIQELLEENPDIKIDKLPVVFIEAKDRKDAKKKAMLISSSYGNISKNSINDFMGDDFEIKELENIDFSIENIQMEDFFKELENNITENQEIDLTAIKNTVRNDFVDCPYCEKSFEIKNKKNDNE